MLFAWVLIHGQTISPDESGILTLEISKAKVNNIKTRTYHDLTICEEWKSNASSVEWNIEIPKNDSYIVEQIYSASAPDNKAKVVYYANNKRLVDLPIPVTWHWNHFMIVRSKKVTIPEGKQKLEVKVAEPTKANMNLAYVRLIPAKYEQKILELRKKPILGASLEDFELLYGKKIPLQQGDSDYEILSTGYKDAALFDSFKDRIKVYLWAPNIAFSIKAAFIDGKCIQAKIEMGEAPGLNKALQHAWLVLGVRFPLPGKKENEITLYYKSKSDKKEYIFQYWNEKAYVIRDLSMAKSLKGE